MNEPAYKRWEGPVFAFFLFAMTGYATLFLWAWGQVVITEVYPVETP